VQGIEDTLLEKSIPSDTRVIKVKALSSSATKIFGLGNLGIRAYWHLKKAAESLLSQERFDLVYFSTTMFVSMALGPSWFYKYKVPYILDFQDPWLSDYYCQNKDQVPPGGKFKYGFSQFLAKYLEPYAL